MRQASGILPFSENNFFSNSPSSVSMKLPVDLIQGKILRLELFNFFKLGQGGIIEISKTGLGAAADLPQETELQIIL